MLRLLSSLHHGHTCIGRWSDMIWYGKGRNEARRDDGGTKVIWLPIRSDLMTELISFVAQWREARSGESWLVLP